jgi:hypothetical protein
MKNLQPHRLQTEPCLRIDQSWTPEQAMAVFELITDLRDHIWSHYDLALQEQYQRNQLEDQGWEYQLEEKDPDVPF